VTGGTITDFFSGISFEGALPKSSDKISGVTAESNLHEGFTGHIASITKSSAIENGGDGVSTDVTAGNVSLDCTGTVVCTAT
jgi:hypothetical protein